MQIYDLSIDPKLCSEQMVGGKAYNLMSLNSVNINIPAGFVLSADFKQDLIRESELSAHLTKLKSKWVMVRSSAIGEDGVDHSFAGQLESFQVLNSKIEIIEAIEKCWMSLKNKRVQEYELKFSQELSKMGVIVQEMIEPDYAGVLFTRSPQGEDYSLVEYVEGHCEKLVQGEVTPVSKFIRKEEDFPFPINDLVKNANKIKDYYKTEQDIEWAYKNGVFHIVQTRPITKLKKQIRWSSTNVNENYPDKLSPLLYSIARRSYYFYFKNIARELGIQLPRESEQVFTNTIGVWGQRMYYNMSHLHTLFSYTPFDKLITKSFDNFVGYQKGKNFKELTNSMLNKFRFIYGVIRHWFKLATHVSLIKRRVDRYYDKRVEVSSLAEDYHEFLDLRFNFWYHASFADFFSMLFHGSLGHFLTTLKLEDAVQKQNNLIQSIPNLISNEPIFKLWEIKKEIEKQQLQNFFIENTAEIVLAELSTRSIKIELMVKDYIQAWGFRCTGELTFLGQNYIENPVGFIKMLQTYIKTHDLDPNLHFKQKQLEQAQFLLALEKQIKKKYHFMKSFFQIKILRFLVNATMKSISARETVRLRQAKMYFKFKQVCLRLGQELEAKELITRSQDIFFLEYDEISRLLNGEEIDWKYIKDLINLRQEQFERAEEKAENIASFAGEFDNVFIDQDLLQVKDKYSGLAACGGLVRARAVVIDSIQDIDQLQTGDILVTKQTDPGWICAFPLISGLVVERGGMLSHGAIVAREFGIPAVVGIKGITKLIKTGDIIEVDGNRGRVNVEL